MSTELVILKKAEPTVAGEFVPQKYELTYTETNLKAMLEPISLDVQMAPLYEVDSDDLAEELRQTLERIQNVKADVENTRIKAKRPVLEMGALIDNPHNAVFSLLDKIVKEGTSKLAAWAQQKSAAARRKAEEEAEALTKANEAAAQAQALREAGSEQVADALVNDAMVAVDRARENAAAATMALHTGPVTVLPAAARVKGQRSTWKAEVTNKSLFISHVAKLIAEGDKSLIDALDVSQSAIDALARVQKQHLSIPGLRPYENTTVAVRRGASPAPSAPANEPAAEPA